MTKPPLKLTWLPLLASIFVYTDWKELTKMAAYHLDKQSAITTGCSGLTAVDKG
jgi:hypothetical protein